MKVILAAICISVIAANPANAECFLGIFGCHHHHHHVIHYQHHHRSGRMRIVVHKVIVVKKVKVKSPSHAAIRHPDIILPPLK